MKKKEDKSVVPQFVSPQFFLRKAAKNHSTSMKKQQRQSPHNTKNRAKIKTVTQSPTDPKQGNVSLAQAKRFTIKR